MIVPAFTLRQLSESEFTGLLNLQNKIKILIEKARESCKNAGQKVTDHFPDVRKVIEAGKGSSHIYI